MADLTSFESFIAWNGEVAGTDVEGVKALITACSQWFRSVTSRDIDLRSYTRRFDGRNNTRLLLPHYPVTAVTSLRIGGLAIPAQPGESQPGYFFDADSIALEGYRFERGTGNVSVAWQAGYAAIPADIEQAVNELVGLRHAMRDKQGWASKSLAGETVSLLTKDMPDSVRTVVEQYRAVAP